MKKIMEKDGQAVHVDVASGSVEVMEELGWKVTGDAPPERTEESSEQALASSGWRPPITRADLDRAIEALPGPNDDPEYVVSGMKRYFGDLFNSNDEQAVRDAFSGDDPSENNGVDQKYQAMSKAQLKELLDAKGLPYGPNDNKAKLVEIMKAAA